MGLLRQFEGLGGMLQSRLGMFMTGQMVALSVVFHRRVVGMRRPLVKFGGFLMRIVHMLDPYPMVPVARSRQT